MLQIGEAIVSLDLLEKKFICDLNACKGICCVEGDSGAPLEEEELLVIEEILPEIEKDLAPEALEVIRKEGVAVIDVEGDLVTPIVNGKECVYTYFDEDGTCKCAMEKAYIEGRIDFKKPISCHLYPVRVKKYKDFVGINYDEWEICKSACALGQEVGLPLFKYLKEPLIRKFGQDWYDQLEYAGEHKDEIFK